MRVWIVLAIVLLSAGCSGLDLGSAEQPDVTATATETDNTVREPEGTATQEPTQSSEPEVQNPWNKQTVTIFFQSLSDTANETRHREALRAAVEWYNTVQPGDYPVQFEIVETRSADVTVTAEDTIERCGTSIAVGTYYWCSPSVDKTSDPDSSEEIRVTTQYEQNATKQFYRKAVAHFAGVEEPGERTDINVPEDPALVNPWPRKDKIHVSIENAENWSLAKSQVATAIDYWETGPGAAYRNYSQEMAVAANDTNAELTVTYKEDIGVCGLTYSGKTGGCAPIYDGDARAGENPTIEISTQYTPESQQSILKHEFGHVYGRIHGQEPMPLMSARRNLTLKQSPNATERANPWQYNTVTVYIDRQSIRERDQQTAESEFEAAVKYLQNSGDGNVPANVTFDRVTDRDDADIVIESASLDDFTSTGSPYGHDTDNDGELEYYTSQTIRVDDDTPVDHYAYHIAYWMLTPFVGDGDMPEHLDAEDDNREHWEQNR